MSGARSSIFKIDFTRIRESGRSRSPAEFGVWPGPVMWGSGGKTSASLLWSLVDIRAQSICQSTRYTLKYPVLQSYFLLPRKYFRKSRLYYLSTTWPHGLLMGVHYNVLLSRLLLLEARAASCLSMSDIPYSYSSISLARYLRSCVCCSSVKKSEWFSV